MVLKPGRKSSEFQDRFVVCSGSHGRGSLGHVKYVGSWHGPFICNRWYLTRKEIHMKIHPREWLYYVKWRILKALRKIRLYENTLSR